MRIENTQQIEAPVRKVWDLTVDVEALPTLTPTVTRVERLDDQALDVGSAVRIKQPGQRQRVWTVTTLEPDRQFAWSTKAMGMTMTGTHQMAESAAGTVNTLTVDLDGPLAPVMGVLLKRPIRKALAIENQGFKTAAER